jgi:hypothetical protein
MKRRQGELREQQGGGGLAVARRQRAVRAGRAEREAEAGANWEAEAEKAPLRLVRKREEDQERSTPPSNVQERK